MTDIKLPSFDSILFKNSQFLIFLTLKREIETSFISSKCIESEASPPAKYFLSAGRSELHFLTIQKPL